jgi:Domain of unknown function (DUF4157)
MILGSMRHNREFKHDENTKEKAIVALRRKRMQEDDEYMIAKERAQKKAALEISQAKDPQEKEADEVAKKVVEGNSKSEIRNSELNASKTGTVHPKTESDTPPMADANFEQQLDSSKGSGQSLDDATKREMETKMGADFSGVKIHTDSAANAMAEQINAKAFTYGQDIYFKSLKYDPYSKEGKELLAHELWHVVQNRNGAGGKLRRQTMVPMTLPTLRVENIKPHLPPGYIEIYAGYERTLKDIATYYELNYYELKKVNENAYNSIFNHPNVDYTRKLDPRARFNFDTTKLRPNYSVYIPISCLLNHQDPVANKLKFGSFKSYYFTKSNNLRLNKVLAGEEQIEVGESDPSYAKFWDPFQKYNPYAQFISGNVWESNKAGRIYPIQEALSILGLLKGDARLLNRNFSEGGDLHCAIEMLQEVNEITPSFSRNPAWKEKTGGTNRGIINAETLYLIDKKLAEYEAQVKPYFRYESEGDKQTEKANVSDFNNYEKGSGGGEKEYTNQDIKLNGDLFNLTVFNHGSLPYGSVVDLRLSYKGEDKTEKDKADMLYFSHTTKRQGGIGDEQYQFYSGEEVVQPYSYNFIADNKNKNLPESTFTPPSGVLPISANKTTPSDRNFQNTVGYSMVNKNGMEMLYGNPYGIDPKTLPIVAWEPWFAEIQDSLELDQSWTPAARVHRFMIRDNSGINESAMIIIPHFAVRTSDVEKDPTFGVNFDDAAKEDGLTSIKLAIDFYNHVLTELLGLQEFFKGDMPSWLYQDVYVSQNTAFLVGLVAMKQSKDPIDPKKAGALLKTMMMAHESLNMHLGTYMTLSEEQRAEFDSDLSEVKTRWCWAIYGILKDFDEGFAYAVEAKRMSKAIEYKMELLDLQQAGGADARLTRAAQTYFGIKDKTGTPALNAVIEKELLRSKQQLVKRRTEFFHPGDVIEKEEDDYAGLGTDILIGLIEILSIQHLHDTSLAMIDKSDDYTFIWERVNKTKTEVLADLDRSKSIARIEAGFQMGGVYVQAIANQEIAVFYMDVSRPNFQDDINAMIAHIQAVTKANAIFDSILTNVIAFVIAEIITLGMATFLLPALLATEVGVLTVRVLGAMRAIKVIKLLKSGFSITAFTFFSRALTAGGGNESKNSFAEDLMSNLLMMGMMGASMKGVSNVIGKIAPNMGKWGKIGVAQLSALGSLQLFAEGHHLLSEGRLMNADERTQSFFSNLGLHFGMMISGFLLSRPLDIAYKKAYSQVFQIEFKTLFNPKFEKMQGTRSELSDLAADMMMKGHITPEFLNKLGEYFKLEKGLTDSMREQLKTVEGEDGVAMREDFEAANEQRNKEIQSLVDAMELKMTLLGLKSKPGTQAGLFKVKSNKRLSVEHTNLERVRTMLEGEGGVNAKMTEMEKEKLYRVQMADGTVFYLEVEARIKTPSERVNEILGAGGWSKASEAFWADEGMKQYEEMKGDAETNKLIGEMVEEGWKPGEAVPEKYKERMKEVNEKKPTGQDINLDEDFDWSRNPDRVKLLQEKLLAMKRDIAQVKASLELFGLKVSKTTLNEIKQYIFNNPGIEFNRTNYDSWRRLTKGGAELRDAKFIVHEMAEIESMKQKTKDTKFDFFGKDYEKMDNEGRKKWRAQFDLLYYGEQTGKNEFMGGAHSEGLKAEYQFLADYILKLSNGEISLSAPQIAVGDLYRIPKNPRDSFFYDRENWDWSKRKNADVDGYYTFEGVLVKNHHNFELWKSKAGETIEISGNLQKKLGLNTNTPLLSQFIAAVKFYKQ